MMDNKAKQDALAASVSYDIAADRYQETADDLLATYGEGVRPSWVSAEVSIAMALAAQYRVRAQALRESAEKDCDNL